MSQKPTYLKTLSHLDRIQSVSVQFEQKPYGGSNPYHYCGSCNRSMIEASYKGHYPNCQYQKFERIKNKLEKRLKYELECFLKNKDFNKKSFLHYYWDQKTNNISVYGLDNLIKASKEYIQKNQIDAPYFEMFIK